MAPGGHGGIPCGLGRPLTPPIRPTPAWPILLHPIAWTPTPLGAAVTCYQGPQGKARHGPGKSGMDPSDVALTASQRFAHPTPRFRMLVD